MKKGFARRAIAATVALGLGMTLAACSGGGSGGGSGSSVQGGTYKGPKVTVTFWNGWTGGDQQTILTKLVSQFNSSHKNIVIKPVEMQ
ncbi:MAG TPA: ABC transporter substrate-binding protein, partial [Amnibacterium sp.]